MENRHKILIVDDTIANIQILSASLKADYEVLVATNGRKALSILESEFPDVILLDIIMPEMDGYEVCGKLKENPLTRSIPVIFITAMTETEDEAKGLKLGAIDYITKPFSMSLVKARIKNHINLKKYQDHLEKLSLIDGLTGIANRRSFDEHLNKEWRRSARIPRHLSAIMMDIDYFKLYNDAYGHVKGDECLRKVAAALRNAVDRPGDMVARYGGEEFACILPDTNEEGAVSIARRMQEEVASLCMPHRNSTVSRFVSLSFGVSTIIPSCNTPPSNLIEFADKLLYEAKQAGRNQIKGMVVEDSCVKINGSEIKWNDNLFTGNDILDIQHKELINRISELLNEISLSNTTSFRNIIDFLSNYVFEHFALEEKLMMQTGYPEFDNHLENHHYYVKYINRLKKNNFISRELMSELRGELFVWFCDHIIDEDCKMAEHLRQYCDRKGNAPDVEDR